MLPANSRTKHTASVLSCLLFAVTALFVLPVNAATTLSAADMIQNIANQIPNLMSFVSALAYVMGFYFIFWGILKLKQYGEMRTQMSSGTSLKGTIIYFVVGTMLMYLPTSVDVLTSTFWGTSSPTAYVEQSADQWSSLLKACILVIQLFGVIALIRGLVMLTHLAGHGGQPGTVSKAMTHMIGGIFCINIYAFVQVIFATLGISSS